MAQYRSRECTSTAGIFSHSSCFWTGSDPQQQTVCKKQRSPIVLLCSAVPRYQAGGAQSGPNVSVLQAAHHICTVPGPIRRVSSRNTIEYRMRTNAYITFRRCGHVWAQGDGCDLRQRPQNVGDWNKMHSTWTCNSQRSQTIRCTRRRGRSQHVQHGTSCRQMLADFMTTAVASDQDVG
jgi:hypothetical protein